MIDIDCFELFRYVKNKNSILVIEKTGGFCLVKLIKLEINIFRNNFFFTVSLKHFGSQWVFALNKTMMYMYINLIVTKGLDKYF